MPTSASGRRERGFTLLEILVVLVIVGIVIGFISVNLTRSDDQLLAAEAERLALLLESARDDAIATGQAAAWAAAAGGYRFWRRGAEGKWEPLADELLRERAFGAPVAVTELAVNGVKVPPDEKLLFTPSGFNQPFRLTLALGASRLQLSGDSLGRISVKSLPPPAR